MNPVQLDSIQDAPSGRSFCNGTVQLALLHPLPAHTNRTRADSWGSLRGPIALWGGAWC
jgi:hypothetical protein